eukprot:CAMPEP_0201734332 /NCGR_PEP_ID=MMETSP0593-20130828/33975_1 /ASSEMBLY_ACC=CAM_ASM_000672 /TAXON_ID=267983 /ORGANISM="Skeletonema japonicum, Strain CCMP2506" /LENGTH=64 /DNA_ID=CAMNT_0048227637 /DNA_START=45 /DNA_END=236 /DNA_ORIENTATION=+
MSASLGRTRRRTSPHFPSPVTSLSSTVISASADAAEEDTITKANGKRKLKGKKPSTSTKKTRQA